MSEKEILVTGCAGFIGFHLSKRLLDEGFHVVGIDNLNDYYDVRLKKDRLAQIEPHTNFTFYEISLENSKEINEVFNTHHIGIVVNLAAQAGVRHSLTHPGNYISSNVVGFLHVLEACRSYNVDHLIYASSSSVYGSNKEIPFSTRHRVDEPLSLYAATKCANELMAHTYSYLFNIPTTGLRFFTVYGPWGRPDMALFKFTSSILEGKAIDVYNHGDMKRDFTYIDDIIEGIMKLLTETPDEEQRQANKSNAPACVYNIGNNHPTDLMTFISLIEKKVGKKAICNYLPMQPGDVKETFADIEDLRKKVGFNPSVSIEEGIEKFVDWYLDYYNQRRKKVGVVGLGYVGLPVAVAFSKKEEVVGFDINQNRIDQLIQGIDKTGELSSEELKESRIHFTTDPVKLSECDFIIVTVPTPIDEANHPDLQPLQNASEIVGKVIEKGTTIVFESTVYPGVTEEICLPILEKASGLEGGKDFFVGYSPERINPGDSTRSFETIVKVVAGQEKVTTERIAKRYQQVVKEIYQAPSIKVAESSKVIENIQRDLNIALMNELSIILNRLGINTYEVLKAAETKWNFHAYTPGLVGGHCIGVDPYYLVYKAKSIGYHPQVIQAGRRLNDSMSEYVAQSLIKLMIQGNINILKSRITILGATFKENVPDIRNSMVKNVIHHLKEYGLDIQLHDLLADPAAVQQEFGIQLNQDSSTLLPADAIIYAVPHSFYMQQDWSFFQTLLKESDSIIMDLKNALTFKHYPSNITVWGL
jgi:UDP-N-acetyl-D-glucosamine/UDP-N-acetyl-D-galactosamine dehydrogenase